ncbi:uncharacterized protein LOC134820073 [Bolinopsis microptera]|uniref:uncharacterized protein LOC134820073 n=1 Tax=Bolinopsis microptera TaxID=2820187 RepID=UPI00307AF01A
MRLTSSLFFFGVVAVCTADLYYNPASPIEEVAVCPGEGPRYQDYKCNHDSTHRVCARLVDNTDGKCDELSWDDEDPDHPRSFWDITNQERWNWKDKVCAAPNPGDSWCICMWATASLIKKVGCDNVHIRCEATSVNYMMEKYTDGGVDLADAKLCLQKKCLQ